MPGRPVGSSRVAPTGCEVLGEEVRVDVGVGDVAAQRRERVVERELVERLVGGGQAAVVAGRQDVEGAVRLPAILVDRGFPSAGAAPTDAPTVTAATNNTTM